MITRVIALLLCGLLLQACTSSTPSLPILGPDDVVLAFGDSLTFGTGSERQQSYPAQLEKMIDRKVINAGRPGETSAEGIKRLPGLLEQHKPSLLILCHGGNDLLRKMDSNHTIANIRTMIEMAQARGIAVVLIGVPKPGLLPSTADFYIDIARDYHLPVETDVLMRIERKSSLKSDPIHPNSDGYGLLAGAIMELLSDTGAI